MADSDSAEKKSAPSEAVNIPDEIVPVPVGGVDQERIKKLNKEQTQDQILKYLSNSRTNPVSFSLYIFMGP